MSNTKGNSCWGIRVWCRLHVDFHIYWLVKESYGSPRYWIGIVPFSKTIKNCACLCALVSFQTLVVEWNIAWRVRMLATPNTSVYFHQVYIFIKCRELTTAISQSRKVKKKYVNYKCTFPFCQHTVILVDRSAMAGRLRISNVIFIKLSFLIIGSW
jgi:hypothetical protein